MPYMSIDGIPTFKNSDIIKIFNWMKNDKTLQTVFYNIDKEIVTDDFFVRFWKRKDIKMFVIFYESKIAGLIWIDRIINSTAMIHINTFKWTWGGNNVQIYINAIGEIFNNYNVDVLIGQMPVTNKMAIRFSKNVGFKKSGIIPKSLYVHKLDKKVDAYVSYALKETFHQDR